MGTKFKKLSALVAESEASLSAAIANINLQQRGAALQLVAAALEAAAPELLKLKVKASEPDEDKCMFGPKMAASVLGLCARAEACAKAAALALEECAPALAAAAEGDAAAARAAASAALAALAAQRAAEATGEATAAAAAAAKWALAVADEQAERARLEELHERAERARRQRGLAPTGAGDDHSSGRWQVEPLGTDCELTMELAMDMQEMAERQGEALRGALTLLKRAERVASRGALQLLVTFTDNVLGQPRARKFRKLRCRNAHLAENVLAVSGGRDALLALGFEEEEWWAGMAGAVEGDEAESEAADSGETRESHGGELFLVLNQVNLDGLQVARTAISYALMHNA